MIALVREDRLVSLAQLDRFLACVALLNSYFDPSTGHSTCTEQPANCYLKKYVNSNMSFSVDIIICDYITVLLGKSIVCPKYVTSTYLAIYLSL